MWGIIVRLLYTAGKNVTKWWGIFRVGLSLMSVCVRILFVAGEGRLRKLHEHGMQVIEASRLAEIVYPAPSKEVRVVGVYSPSKKESG